MAVAPVTSRGIVSLPVPTGGFVFGRNFLRFGQAKNGNERRESGPQTEEDRSADMRRTGKIPQGYVRVRQDHAELRETDKRYEATGGPYVGLRTES